MMTHLLRIAAVIACIVLCTLLPFLPGRYDSLAAPLSMMSQLFGIVGLLLVPVGVLWMVSERRSRSPGKRYGFAIATLVASSFVWVIVSLAAFANGSLSLGFLVLTLWGYVVLKVWPRLRTLKSATPASASVMPLYLLILPVAVALLQLALVRRATEFSRNRAIRKCAPLIADIEQYRAAHGRYPPSLLSVWKDYRPSIIGIKEYQYELSGDAYNLFFEQFTFAFGTREFVMYNPLDQQVMTSHDFDLLRRPHELQWRRGYYAVRDAPHPHWKYFWFD